MRHDPLNDGKCPVADGAPELTDRNQVAVDIFRQAEPSAERVNGEDKAYLYVRPEAVESLMRVHGIPAEDRQETMRRVFTLQDLSNRLRPNRPRPKSSPATAGKSRRRF